MVPASLTLQPQACGDAHLEFTTEAQGSAGRVEKHPPDQLIGDLGKNQYYLIDLVYLIYLIAVLSLRGAVSRVWLRSSLVMQPLVEDEYRGDYRPALLPS
jgi:hypothetical protein